MPLSYDAGFKLLPLSQGIACSLRCDRRQGPQVWRALHRLRLPPPDLDFIYTSLCNKLVVGKRLHSIFAHVPSTCSLCGAVEDMYHRLKACYWLTIPVWVLDCAFPEVLNGSQSPLCL